VSQTMIDPNGHRLTEIFTGMNVADVQSQMDVRKTFLEKMGYELEKRTSIGRNTACPCGSGRKYKKCCLLTGASAPPSYAKVA
jgi:uncharacterized protein YecA (UPF0149 family)